jgi:hypothetical protein|tara:strand:- start:587 stop:733 length:147 start_codon:yes stop_codon:yes gene_type:complete
MAQRLGSLNQAPILAAFKKNLLMANANVAKYLFMNNLKSHVMAMLWPI